MEDSTPNSLPAVNKRAHHSNGLLAIMIAVLIGLAAAVGFYAFMRMRATALIRQNTTLASQITSLKRQVQQQDDINAGIVLAKETYNDPPGGVGLLRGAITYTLPKGWARTPSDDCMGGTRDSTALCEDIVAIMGAQGTPTITASVFDYNSADGDAKTWLQNKYGDLLDYTSPEVHASTEPINGYSAISLTMQQVSNGTLAYAKNYYVIVHGKYAVVVYAQLQDSGVYGSAKPYDYRQQYTPILQQFVQSLKFQE